MAYRDPATGVEYDNYTDYLSEQEQKQAMGTPLPSVYRGPEGSLLNQIDWSDPKHPTLNGYDVAITPEGGVQVTKNNWLLDKGVPLATAGIFGYGAFGPGGYAGLGGSGAGAGAGTAGLPAGSIPLAYAPGATAVNTGALGTAVTAGGGGPIGVIASQAGKGVLERAADAVTSPGSSVPGAIAAGINQYTQDAAANRGTKISYEQEQERLRQSAMNAFQQQLIQREMENRAATKDAMDRLQSASYNMQRKPYVPPTVHSNVAGVPDQTLTNFGIGRTNAPTADEMAAYTAQRDQSRDRLMSGSQLPPLEDPTQRAFFTQPNPNLNPGTLERVGQIAGPAVSIWDKIKKYL